MRGRRSTRKLHVYKRKSKKTTRHNKRHVKRHNKQSIKRRNYRGGISVLPHINQNDRSNNKHILIELNYIKKIVNTYYFEIKYRYLFSEITQGFTYNMLNRTLDTNGVTVESMKSLLNNNDAHILDFINTKI